MGGVWQLYCFFSDEIIFHPFMTLSVLLNDFINLVNIIVHGLRRIANCFILMETHNNLNRKQLI